MTTAIASSGGRCHSVVLTERYARPPRVARTHHRRSHSKLSETQFREGFSAPRYHPNVPPDHPSLDLGRQRRWGGGDYEGPPWGGTLARYLPEVPPSPFKWPLLQVCVWDPASRPGSGALSHQGRVIAIQLTLARKASGKNKLNLKFEGKLEPKLSRSS